MMYLFTPEGYEELKRAIQESEEALLDKSKKRSSDSGQDVWHGEGYKLAMQEGAVLDEMTDELRKIFRSAKVVKPIEQNEKIMLGNGFVIRYKAGAVKKYYMDGFRIGHSISPDRIANGSPMAKVLEGAKVGEIRVLKFENGQKKTMTIEKIVLPSEVEQFLKE
ncbi:MAG: hypothetical protein AAB723_03260 [Patescibacteria group bacterium]